MPRRAAASRRRRPPEPWPREATPGTDAGGVLLVPPAPSRAAWDAWTGFVVEVAARVAELGFRGDEEPWFRGTDGAADALTAGLFRQRLTRSQTAGVEVDAYFEFRARAHEAHGVGADGWDALFFMQHYGVPTRLLDWTATLHTAVFVALEAPAGRTADPARAVVHVLNPYALNALQPDGERRVHSPERVAADYAAALLDPREWDFDVVALYPAHRSARQRAQRGFFTFHGSPRDLARYEGRRRFLRSVALPATAFPAARYMLWLAGTDKYALFPELAGLGESIARKYRLGRPFAAARERQRGARGRR